MAERHPGRWWGEPVSIARAVYRRDLDTVARRIVAILVWSTVVLVGGLAITGVVQFFVHAPDPKWFDIPPDQVGAAGTATPQPSAELHGMFSTLTGILVLVGGGVFAFRVAERLPRFLVLAFVLVIAGAFTGDLIRFNVIKPDDGPPTERRGYLQILEGDNEYILTDLRAYSTASFVAMIVLHLSILPLLVVAARRGLRRLDRPDPDDRSADRVGWDVSALGRSATRRESPGPSDIVRPRRDAMWRRPSTHSDSN